MARSLLQRFQDRYDIAGGIGQAIHGGMLTGGFCWARRAGGYTLYRSLAGSTGPWIAVGATSATAAEPDRIRPIDGSVLPAGQVSWWHVRPVSPGGAEWAGAATPVGIGVDSEGDPVGQAPGAIRTLEAAAGPGGVLRLFWNPPRPAAEYARPSGYQVFHDDGGGELLEEPAAEVPRPAATIGPYTHGLRVRVAVAAVSALGVLGPVSRIVAVVADAEGPPAVPAPGLALGREE